MAEAGFTRFGTIARQVASGNWLTWLIQYPVQWMLPNQYDPVDAIAKLSGLPILIVHSRADQVIPYEHGLDLYESAGLNKEFLESYGPHIASVRYPETRAAILDFMQSRSGNRP